MQLFKRKDKRYMLKYGLIAEAITIYSDKIDLESLKYNKIHPSDIININEHLKIEVDNVWHTHVFERVVLAGFGTWCHLDYYTMNIKIYVDNVEISTHQFKLDIKYDNELYREWSCEEENIIHVIPNQFAKSLNEWCEHIIRDFNKKRYMVNDKQRSYAQIKYDGEETVLSKYRESKDVGKYNWANLKKKENRNKILEKIPGILMISIGIFLIFGTMNEQMFYDEYMASKWVFECFIGLLLILYGGLFLSW